jgi:hypothetical protein
MFKRSVILFLAITIMIFAFAGSALAVSGAGAIILEFPIGARGNALGESGTALIQDATSIWWNPAGLAFAGDTYRGQFHAMHSKLVPDLADDIYLSWVGYTSQVAGGNFAVSTTYLSMGEQIATDDSGDPRGKFTSYMFSCSTAYGSRLSQNTGFGIGVKFYHDKLAPDYVLQDGNGGSASTFAVDAGILHKVPSLKSNFAVTVSNIGPSIKHVDADQSDPLPRKLTLGIASSLFYTDVTSLLFVADYLIPLMDWNYNTEDYGFAPDFDEHEWGAGTEWSYDNSMFLRLGYKKGTGQISGLTWGLGFDMGKWVGKDMVFGYSSVPQATGLSNVNRFSIGYNF